MRTEKIGIRVVVYCFGLLLMAFGVTFSVLSNLGISPVNSIPYVSSLLTGIDQGVMTTMIFTSYVVAQICILRKEFKIINLLQIVFASAFGFFVTFSNYVLSFLHSPEHYILQLLYLAISIILIAIGLMFYLTADIVPQPAEGLMLAIQSKTNIDFPKIKTTFDSTVVVIAIIISLVGFGEVRGVREGTLLSAIFIGRVLGLISRRYRSKLEKMLHG